MATRMVIRGRRYRMGPHGDLFPDEEKKAEVGVDAYGNQLDTWPIAPNKKMVEFRAGIPYDCPVDRLTYRVLKKCKPSEGWAAAEYWRRRWGITFETLKLFCKKGWMQPGLEEGSPTKRFRCVDEAIVIDWLETHRGKQMRRFQIKWGGR